MTEREPARHRQAIRAQAGLPSLGGIRGRWNPLRIAALSTLASPLSIREIVFNIQRIL